MNKLTMVRYAKWAKADQVLEKNPSAKVFRRIVLEFTPDQVTLTFGDVTKVTSEGGYCNGVDNETTYQIKPETFFSDDLGAILADEPYAAVLASYRIQESLKSQADGLRAILVIE